MRSCVRRAPGAEEKKWRASGGGRAQFATVHHQRYSFVMRALRHSINVTLDGCCDHRAMIADEDLHRHALENLEQADALLLGCCRCRARQDQRRWRSGVREDWWRNHVSCVLRRGPPTLRSRPRRLAGLSGWRCSVRAHSLVVHFSHRDGLANGGLTSADLVRRVRWLVDVQPT